MLRTWKAWTDEYGAAHDANLTENYLSRLDERFEDNLSMCLEIVVSHINHLPGIASTTVTHNAIAPIAMLTTAALMFWARPHAILEATDALENLLVNSDLGDDLPVGLIRPPVPACYIKFGQAFQDAVFTTPHHQSLGKNRLQGVYVFEAVRKGQRALTFVPIFEFDKYSQVSAAILPMLIDDEEESAKQCIDDAIALENAPSLLEHYQSVVQICTKVFLYMNASQSMQLDDQSYTLAEKQLSNYGPKKFAKRRQQIAHLYDRILVGPQTLAQLEGDEHSEVSPHMRRGHFRLQPHGPQQSLRKVIFIAPTWIRADRL
jgi:hypothetical protein